MKCPRCGHEDDKVIDSRIVRDGRGVRRRRECSHCQGRYTTYETIETKPVLVVKRSGERTAYSRAKVIVGVTKACEKRPVSLEEIEIIVDQVEQRLASSGRREVPSEAIGSLVLDELRTVDEVAYVRFASVYRSFQSIGEFFNLLRDMKVDLASGDPQDPDISA